MVKASTKKTHKKAAPVLEAEIVELPVTKPEKNIAASSSPSISVIIVSYFTGPILRRSVEAALAEGRVKEVILVNNGNPDIVDAYWLAQASENSRVKYISGHGNIGYARGCNLGAKEATGSVLLLLNPDCILLPNTVNILCEALSEHPEAWVASCTLLNPDGSLQGGSKRNILTPWIAMHESLRLSRVLPMLRLTPLNLPEKAGDAGAPEYVPATTGAIMMLPAERWRELGGFDEQFFFHVEDLDLCKTIHDRGGKVLFVPAARVVHYRSTSDVSSAFIEQHKNRGFLTYFRKHYQGIWGDSGLLLLRAGIALRYFSKLPVILLSERRKHRERQRDQLREMQQRKLLEDLPKDSAPFSHPDTQPADTSKRVILAGATGQVGIAILRHLLAQGYTVYALYHQHVVRYSHPNLHWIQADLSTRHLALGDIKAEILIHTPGLWNLSENLEAFARHGIERVIAFSSTSIEGKSLSQNPYEIKLVEQFKRAEKNVSDICNRLRIPFTFFRPTLIYGNGLDRNISQVVRFMERFGLFPIYNGAQGKRQPVHADDLARAVLSAMSNTSTHGKHYNLSGASVLTYREMLRSVCKVLGRKPLLISSRFLPNVMDIASHFSSNPELNGEVAKRMSYDLAFAHDSATADFGYTPREFLAGGMKDLGFVPKSVRATIEEK